MEEETKKKYKCKTHGETDLWMCFSLPKENRLFCLECLGDFYKTQGFELEEIKD